MDSADLLASGLVADPAPSRPATRVEEGRNPVSRGEQVWQRRLLPLMIGMVVVLTAFFFVASFVQLYYLQTRIENAPQLDLKPALTSLDNVEAGLKAQGGAAAASQESRIEFVKWKSLLLLEGNALQRRYHQAGVLLISRIWTRYLGFVTGMILALVGAVFILGKLRESSSTLGAESGAWKMSVTSASPGLILAVLGTILMLATLATNLEMQVNDGPVYLGQSASFEPQPAPQSLSPEGAGTGAATDSEILGKMKGESGAKK